MSSLEKIVYILANILSFGTPWLIKIIIKKAIIETQR